MILLTSTSDKLQLVTGNGGADVDVHVSFVDNNAGTITPSRLNVSGIATATTTDIVGSPASSVQRNVKNITVNNVSGSVSEQVTVRHTDGTNVVDLFSVNLFPNEKLICNDEGEWLHYDAQGAEYTPVMPNDYLFATSPLGTLSETIPRILCPEVSLSALTSGTLYLVAIFLKAGQIINNISFFSSSTAAGTPTNGFFALYDVNRNLLAETANFTTETWTSNTIKTKSLTSSYKVPSTGLYYVGIMITATTMPTLKGLTGKSGTQLAAIAPVLHGNSTAGLTTALPNPAGSVAGSGSCVWAAVS